MKIGLGVPLSGMAAALGREMAHAVELAVDDANLHTGAGGPVVTLSILDDEGHERTGEAAARTFCADPEIVAVIGHYNSNVTLAVAPIYASSDLPLIGPIVSNPALTDSGWRNVFRFTNRDDATASALVHYLVQQRHKCRAVVVTTKTVYGASMSLEFMRAFERLGGKVLGEYRVEEGEKDLRELVGKFPADIDLVFYGGSFEGAFLLKALRKAGIGTLFAAGDGCWDIANFLEPAGICAEQGEGVLILSACPQLGWVNGSMDFAARFERRFGSIGNYAVNAYDAASLTIDRLRSAAQSTSRPSDRQSALDAIRGCRRQGIAYPEPVSWDEKGDNLAAVTALYDVKDGRYRQLAVVPRR